MSGTGPKTLRNLRLKPGAEMFKRTLRNRQATVPRVVSVSNFFPGSEQTRRPTVNTRSRSTTPPQLSYASSSNFFPNSKKPSIFNISPKNWRLRNKQAAAMKEAEGKNHIAFPMNYSQVEGESGGGKKRKTRRYRKHRK